MTYNDYELANVKFIYGGCVFLTIVLNFSNSDRMMRILKYLRIYKF